MSGGPKKIAPYLVFAGEMRDVAKEELIAAGNAKPSMGEIAKAVGEKWKQLDDDAKQVRRSPSEKENTLARPARVEKRGVFELGILFMDTRPPLSRSAVPSRQVFKDKAEAINAEAVRVHKERAQAEGGEEVRPTTARRSAPVSAHPRARPRTSLFEPSSRALGWHPTPTSSVRKNT